MANLRTLKKDIDYLIEEVLADCYLTVYFHPEKQDAVVALMQRAVDERNSLFDRVNNPPAKGGSLAHKHYAAVRRDLFDKADALFTELSAIGK
jgi:hypothetical protein